MYLSGMGGIRVQTADGGVENFSSIVVRLDEMLQKLTQQGGSVTNPATGHVYRVSQFANGWLLDGCPLNVVFGQGWVPGQREALQAAGITPGCPENVVSAPMVPLVKEAPTLAPKTYYAPPTLTSGAASGTQFARSGSGAGKTGVSTPTAPTMVYRDGGLVLLPPEPAEPETAVEPRPSEATEPYWVPWLIAGAALLVAMRRR